MYCNAIIKKSLSQKSKDPESFTSLVTIENFTLGKALLDLGASINLMLLSMLKKVGDVEILPTMMTLQLAYRSINYPHGIVTNQFNPVRNQIIVLLTRDQISYLTP